MSKLGQHLKSEREKRGLSLHEIGLSLKINPKILAALEEGQKENLPAKTFLRGFVRSYAQYLRLNVDEALQMFNEEYGAVRPEPPKTISPEAGVEPPPSVPLRSRASEEPGREPESNRLILIGAGILLFILVVFVAKMVDKYQKERTTRPLPIETPKTAEEPTPSPSPGSAAETVPTAKEAQKTPSPTASPLLTGQMGASPSPAPMTPIVPTPTATPKPTATPSPTPSPKPAPSVTPTATPTPKPSPTATPTPAPSPTPSATPKPSPTPSAVPSPSATPEASPSPAGPRPTEVIIETLNTVTINYTLSDGRSGTLNLSANQLHTLRSRGKVTLEVSDGGSVNLIVNGRDRGVPGQIGQPVKLTLP
jgi:cytoskeleton protein RodZ